MQEQRQALVEAMAAILAGGLGTRLRPVLAQRPKVLASVNGRPYLSYLLDQLEGTGVRTVVVCTGYLGEQVRAAFGNSYRGINLLYSQESVPLGTAGALRLALPLFKSEVVLVMNGDSYCEADLKAFWMFHRERRSQGSLLLAKVDDTRAHGRVRMDGEGVVTAFNEKGICREPGWINAGVYLLSRSLLQTIPQTFSLEKDVFPQWVTAGLLHGYSSQGRFIDIGTPESYARAEEFFAPMVTR